MCSHIDLALTTLRFQEPEYSPDHIPKWSRESIPDEASIIRGFKVITPDWLPPFKDLFVCNLHYKYRSGWNTAYELHCENHFEYLRPMCIRSIEDIREEALTDDEGAVYSGLHFFTSEEAAICACNGMIYKPCFALKSNIIAFGVKNDCVATRLFIEPYMIDRGGGPMTERMVTNFCRECVERQAELDRTNKRLIQVLEEKIEADKLVKTLSTCWAEQADTINRRAVELGEMKLVLESQDLRLKKFHGEIARLREAIRHEAKKHISGEAGVSCCCDLCDIAREGR